MAVNAAFTLADWIPIVYFGDRGFFKRFEQPLSQFAGLKLTTARVLMGKPGVKVVKMKNGIGLSRDPRVVLWNKSSGACAINFAVHFGVKRIVLFGYDMRQAIPDRVGIERRDTDNRLRVVNQYTGQVIRDNILKREEADAAKARPQSHWHQFYSEPTGKVVLPYTKFLSAFSQVAHALRGLNVQCINATPGSALKEFPIVHPDEVMP